MTGRYHLRRHNDTNFLKISHFTPEALSNQLKTLSFLINLSIFKTMNHFQQCSDNETSCPVRLYICADSLKLFGFVCIFPRQVVRTAPWLGRLLRTCKKLKFLRGTPPQVLLLRRRQRRRLGRLLHDVLCCI